MPINPVKKEHLQGAGRQHGAEPNPILGLGRGQIDLHGRRRRAHQQDHQVDFPAPRQ
jgi:hypothetical protein